MNPSQIPLGLGVSTSEASVADARHEEPTPEILLRSTLIDGFLNRSQSIGLYTSISDLPFDVSPDNDVRPRSGKLSSSAEMHTVNASPQQVANSRTSAVDGDKSLLRVSQLKLNESFVRSSSTGVNFESLPSSNIDMVTSSTSASPTGFTDPGMSRSWSPISSVDDAVTSADSALESFESTIMPLNKSIQPLYTSVRLLRLDGDSSQDQIEPVALMQAAQHRFRGDHYLAASSTEPQLAATPLKLAMDTQKENILSGSAPVSPRVTSPVASSSIASLSMTSMETSPPAVKREIPGISVTKVESVFSDPMSEASKKPAIVVSRPIFDTSAFGNRPSSSDIYVSPAQDFETFSSKLSEEKLERLSEPYRKEFTDMFTASQLVSLKYIVDLAKDDPHHVLLGLRHALESEMLLRQKQISIVKNWNKEFWKLVRLPDSEFKFQAMKALAQDFVFTSETYGRLIISEMYLPTSEKTVHPLRLGGIAGGQKFVCQGILFKFAMDVALDAHGSTVWMYGGSDPCNEYAMKSAKHEFNGIVAVNNLRWQGVSDIRVALTSIIDFRGFRLSCQALLPIGKTSLVYGSDDGGTTHMDDQGFRESMQNVCSTLNLKAHGFTPSRCTSRAVYGPVDLEGHRVGKALYAVDLARLFPPESPRQGLAPKSRSQFFRMLRPELVRQFHKPLSSDAHTAFGRDESATHNAEVDEATQFLQQTVIPSFAETLANKHHLKQYTEGAILVRELHRWGINLRYMGLVRSKLSLHNASGRHLLLLEMVLRSLKNMFRRKLRKQMEATRISMDSPYAEVVLDLLNLFLGKDENSKVFWRVTIKEALREMFVVGLTDDELTAGVSLKRGLNMQALLDRFQVLTGVKLIPSASTYRKGKNDVILYTDLEAVQNTVTKHMQIVDYAEGALLLLLSEKKADQAEKLRLLSLAESRLKLARGSAMGNQSLYQLGQVFYMRHKVASKLDLVDVLNALTYYRAVIESSSDEAHLMVSLKHTLELYYIFVSNSVWLQKKLFGSELISPFLNPLIPLPSPTTTLPASNIDSPSITLNGPHSTTHAHSKQSSIEKISPRTRNEHSKHSPRASATEPLTHSPKNASPPVLAALKTSGGSPNEMVSSRSSSQQSGSVTSSQASTSVRSSLNMTASLEKPKGARPHFLSSHGTQSDLDLFASVASLRRTTGASGTIISTLFHQHCCLVFEKLASLNYKDAIKDASRYVKDASSRQGDSLRWIFEVSLYSPFVRDRLRLYLQRQPLLSVPYCPQLFAAKQNSVVYRFLLSMRAPERRKKNSSSQSGKRTHASTLSSDVSNSSKHHQQSQAHSSSESLSSKREKREERHSSTLPVLPAFSEGFDLAALGYGIGSLPDESPRHLDSPSSSMASTQVSSPHGSFTGDMPTSATSCKLPACISLNLTECTPVTSTVVTAILNETPNLEVLILDHCSKISNKLASILGPVPGKRGAIKLRELSLAGCSKITDTFIENMLVKSEEGSLSSSSSNNVPANGNQNGGNGNSSPPGSVSAGTFQSATTHGERHHSHHGHGSHGNSGHQAHQGHVPSKSESAPLKVKRGRSGSTTGATSKSDRERLEASTSQYVPAPNPAPMVNTAGASSLLAQSVSSQRRMSRMVSTKQLNLLRDVTSLRLSRCRQLTDESLRNIALMCGAKLVELDMSYSKVSDLTPLTGSTNLRRLLMSSTMIRDVAVHQFLMTDAFRGLHELHVANCHLSDQLLGPLNGNIQMRSLNVTGNAVGDGTLTKLSQYAPHLSDLDVGTVTLDHREVLVTLAERLPHLTRLKMVNAQNGINGALISMQKAHVPMQHLEVPWCSVRDIVVHGLGATFPSLHTIDLTGSPLSNAPLEKLKHCVNLTSLNLSWCTQLVDPTVLEITGECTQLTTLALAHCPQVTSHGLHRLPRTLTNLDLSHCPNVTDLGPLRSQCIQLTALNLAACLIPEERLLSLFGSGISLRSINLKGCKQVSSKFVSRMAKYCPLLHKAILDECISITEDGLLPLLTECPYLQRITLTGVFHVTDACIVTAIQNHGLRHLKELNLSGCNRITDTAVSAIATNCALLNDLSLSGCSLVSSKSVILLADHCQILLSLNIFGCKLIRSDILSHLAQHCKVLERVTGAMNAGIDAATLKNLPFKLE